MLISVSAVSAADLDDSNETVALYDIGVEKLSVSNDVNAIDDLNKDDAGSEAVLENAVKSSAAGEKEILSVGDSGSDVLGAKGSKITIDEAYSQKIGSDYKIIVTGYVRGADDEDINTGTVSIYLNDDFKKYCDAEFGMFSGEVDVGPGSYNVRVRYHDDSGDYDDSQNNYYDNPIIIKPPEPVTWYVDGSKPYGGGGKSEADAFSTLSEALVAASNNDTVKFAAGTYAGSANIGQYINKILTFEKYGDGEAIFDGQGQGTIWSVGVDTINIYGLTFINGVDYYGGALYFLRDVSNSVINATFINNSVSIYGGAIYVGNSVSNLTLRSTFINNTANEYGAAVYIKNTASNLILNSTFIGNTADNKGAAVYIGDAADNVKVYGEYINNTASQGVVIYANKAFSSSVIDATFINNTAKELDGAFCFNGDLTGVDISGKFLNNTGGDSIIYVANSVSGNSIHDSVFLNNEAYKIITVYNGEVTATDNWFGSDASNYYKIPEDVGIDLENWLFLNATADPSELAADEKSTIIFKLSSFDGSEIIDYDASKMNIVLDLSQTLGALDKTSASIGENITYTAKDSGNATVTGKFETASYTVKITNANSRTPTSINVTNSTVDLKVNGEIAAGATLTPADAGNLTYNSSNSSVAVVENGKIKALAAGSANITVSFAGDETYAPSSNTIAVTVTLNDASLRVNNVTLNLLIDDEFVLVATTTPEGLNVTFTPDNSGVVSVDENGVVTALKEGEASVKVSVGGDGVYALNSTTVAVSVSKIPTEIEIASKSIDLIVRENASSDAFLIPSEAGNLTYVSSNELVAKMVDGMIVAVGEGNATITVSFAGDDKYLAAESKIDVSVKKTDSSMDIEPKIVELIVGEEATFTVILPDDATGVVLVDVGDNKYYADVENGNATVKLVGLTPGNYTADVVYQGDDKYTNASGNIDVKVEDIILPEVTITVPDVKVGETAKVIVELPENATGMVAAIVDGNNVVAILASDSTVEIPLGELSAGNHSVVVLYKGNRIYGTGGDFKNFTVEKLSTNITAEPVEIKEGETATVIVAVDTNDTGSVLVDVSGIKSFAIVENGTAAVDVVGLTAGNYTALIVYMGDENYSANSTSVSVKVEKLESNVIITVPSDVKAGQDVPIDVEVPGATGSVAVIVDGNETIISLVDGKANYTVPAISAGDHSIVVIYSGDDTHDGTWNADEISVIVLPTEIKDITVFSDFNITARLVDIEGNPVANAAVTYLMGNVTYNVTTASDGSFTVSAVEGEEILIGYAGNDTLFATNTTLTINDITPPVVVPIESRFNVTEGANTVYGYAVDTKAGEQGMPYETELLDINGNPISGVPIQFGVNSKIYNRTTYENGSFAPYHLNMLRAGIYTLAFSFGGNENYTSAFAVVAIDLAKKPITIKANAKSYKASAKTKKYTVTLSTIVGSSADGKAHLRSGLTVTMKINSKTYTSKTNSKGQVTFNLKITKKGKFQATISYKGDQTYEEATKNVKITIK